MNRHVRERMTALGVRNVALALILMSYTWNPASGRVPEEWWPTGSTTSSASTTTATSRPRC